MCSSRIKIFKPLEDMQILIDAILPFAEVHSSRPHRNFYLTEKGEGIIYLIQEGTIFIHRLSDGMVLGTGYSPLIMGLTGDILMGESDYYFTSETDITYNIISLKKTREIIKDNNLWQHYASHQSYLLKYISINSAKITALPAYEVIRNQLLNLLREPDEIRLRITAAQYIQERTRLSRSGIMKVLSELKTGNYITISEGTLVHINKLPNNF